MKPQHKLIALYGVAMAAGALLLDWLEVQYLLKRFSTEIYVVILCGLFTGTGAWLGHKLTRRTSAESFAFNAEARSYLGISEREIDVLTLLAAGHSNQEIADKLFISANTVKTHLKSLYPKLGASRRGQAVTRARELRLVP